MLAVRAESAVFRVSATALLLVHFLVAGLAPLADVHADPIDQHAIPHLTTPQGDDCPPAHDDLSCQICRTLQGLSKPISTRDRLAHAVTLRVDGFAATARIAHATGSFSPVRARGPPAA